MPSLTIRLPEEFLKEIDMRAESLHISRSLYIRKSIKDMNMKIQRNERIAKLSKASERVRKESISINSEFAKIENDTET